MRLAPTIFLALAAPSAPARAAGSRCALLLAPLFWAVVFLAPLFLGGTMTHASSSPEQCAALIAKIDWMMQRAKVAPDAARIIEQARTEAITHQDAGQFAACAAAAGQALKVLGG